MSKHDLAKKARINKLSQIIQLMNACECEYPIVRMRNLHGHGKTSDGKPCPAIVVWHQQQAWRDEMQALLEEL